MKRRILGGSRHISSYRWYRKHLQKRRERAGFNREHRETEEREATGINRTIPEGVWSMQTVISAHRSSMQRIGIFVTLPLFVISGCLFFGAVIDALLAKAGAISQALVLGCVTPVFFVLWRSARISPGGVLDGDVYGHVEHSSVRMHEGSPHNVEVLAMTIVPEQTSGVGLGPLDVEVSGDHIEGDVHPGDKVVLHATWHRGGPIRVHQLYDLTTRSWVKAKHFFDITETFEEILFMALAAIVVMTFFLGLAKLLFLS